MESLAFFYSVARRVAHFFVRKHRENRCEHKTQIQFRVSKVPKLEFQHMPAKKSHRPTRRQTHVLPTTTTTLMGSEQNPLYEEHEQHADRKTTRRGMSTSYKLEQTLEPCNPSTTTLIFNSKAYSWRLHGSCVYAFTLFGATFHFTHPAMRPAAR